MSKDTLGRVLIDAVNSNPDGDAVVHHRRGVRLSYAEFSSQVVAAAQGLSARGVSVGQHVALWGENTPEWLVAQFALATLGAVWIPVDPGYGPADLAYLVGNAETETIILQKKFFDVLRQARDGSETRQSMAPLQRIVTWDDGPTPEGTIDWPEILAGSETAAALDAAGDNVRPGDVTSIMYTSGTTGRPKGVMVNHESLIMKSRGTAERQRLTGADRMVLTVPLFHMFGNTCIVVSGVIAAAALIMPDDAFDPGTALEAMEAERCSAVHGTPNMMIAMMNEPSFAGRDLSALRTGAVGGAPCPLEVMNKIIDQMGAREVTIAYGITEASSWVTMTQPDDPPELRVSTIGTPLPGVEIKIVDPATEAEQPPGRPGEICTRPGLMVGYYRMSGLTKRVIDRDGWFHTGDLGTKDGQGYVRITGRIKDVITRDGAEIFPAEIEDVLYRLAGVGEVQVFGVDHDTRGQIVAAWVKLAPGSALTG
ncbi:MAG: AMP-binding protein, partial [Proteobacteria bacterium]|nr:AMP-binding protein [Pseudomonadota bacterium]